MSIVFFGPTPPPIHGVSLSLKMCYEYCLQKGINADFIGTNLARPLHSVSEGRWAEVSYMLKLFFKVTKVSILNRNSAVYLACATKGFPVYRDILLALVMRVFFRRFTVHFHGTELANSKGFFRRLVILAYARSDKIYGSEKLADEQRFLERPGYRAVVIPNGVPDHQVLPIEERFELLSSEGSTLRLLFLSNLLATKGLAEFIETLRQLNIDGVRFRAKICGAWSRQFSKESLCRLLSNSGVIEFVDFIGPVDQAQKIAILAESDILLFPSYRESFGNVVIEAMSAGVLVIANKTTAMPFILDHGRAGVILDSYTAQEAATIIKNLSLVTHKKLIAYARARYVSEFTIDKHASALVGSLVPCN